MRISRDPKRPERYKCANFVECGVSSSHDPEYSGWVRFNGWDWACCSHCAGKVMLRKAAAFL